MSERVAKKHWPLSHHWSVVTDDDVERLSLKPRRALEATAQKHVISEILLAHRAGMIVVAFQQPGAYKHLRRYHPAGFSSTYNRRIFENLLAAGLVTIDEPPHRKRNGRTHVHATPLLVNTLAHVKGFKHHPSETIILEESNHRLLAYDDTPDIQLRRLRLHEISRAVANIVLTIPGVDLSHDVVEIDGALILPQKRTLERRYRAAWDQGGSVVDPFFASLPPSAAKALQIEGESTQIIDLAHAYPRMLGALHGGAVDHGPVDNAVHADVAQIALFFLLFASTRQQAINGLKIELSFQHLPGDAHLVIAEICARYQTFSSSFYSGVGRRLQKLLSDLSVEILADALHRGVAALLHREKLIVRTSQASELRAIAEAHLSELLKNLKR